MFELLAGGVGFLGGAVAAVSGFGMGSLLTPLLAWKFGPRLAVALVAVPHLAATAFRFWRLRAHLDRKVLLSFGLTSAAGGLTGAFLEARLAGEALSLVFGSLLCFTALGSLTGLSRRMRFGGYGAWLAGAASGFFGGLVGNQGGIRSAALMGFDVDRHAFVATATAVGVIVDLARLPVYARAHGWAMLSVWPLLAVISAGALAGTIVGQDVLRRLPEALYRRLIALLILALGVYMLWSAA